MSVAILIPAAGSARRMRGRDKLLEPVDGVPLLRRQARAALAVTPLVVVTLREAAGDRAAALAGLAVRIVELGAAAAEGMAASIRHGVAAAEGTGADALAILPADMPEIGADDLARVLTAQAEDPRAILRGAAEDGTPGHPVLFPRDLWPDLARCSGDEGARAVLRRHADRIRAVLLPGRHALTDLDTPEDWAAWRAARSAGQ
ncbi:MAG: NTP transferase domain-containing protein [Gemmobacter sp.]